MRSPRPPIALSAAALAAALLPGAAGATWRGSAGRVVYEAQTSGSSLFSIRPDGTGNRLLIKHGNEPALSPDGRHIVFYRDNGLHRGVFVARADGTHVHRVVKGFRDTIFHPNQKSSTDVFFDPNWSPHGNHISFTADFEEEFGDEQVRTRQVVYVVRANGSHRRRLHRGHDAVWSPRNRRIAFVAGNRIESIRPDGHKLRVLRRTKNYVGRVDYSPDGRRLVYQVGSGPGHIEVLNVRTRKHHIIPAKRLGWPTDVSWAPGGKRIAYLHQHIPPSGQVFPPTVMRTIRPNGTGRRNVFSFRPQLWPDSFWWQTRP